MSLSVVQAQDASSFTVGMDAPVNLDPALGTGDPEILFNRAIYDYLIDVAPDGSLVNNLANDVSISDDGLTYTVSLVEGATFHNGDAFTSADVVYTFTRLQEVESPAINLLGGFEVAADGDSTVVFTLEEANADFMFGLASRWAFVIQDGMAEPNVLLDGDDEFANFNGTGAFVLTGYEPGVSATFAANENYWLAGAPGVDVLEFLYFGEKQAEIDAVRSGAIDFAFKIPFDRVDELDAEDGVAVVVKATNQHPVIRLRADEGFLGADVNVTQAFKLATDRELLNLDLFDGRATVGNNDPIGPLYGPFFNVVEQDYNPEAACELLAEAGYPDGLGADEPLEFYVVDAFNYEQMAVLLQDQWSQACINVEILMRPENVYYGDNEWLDVELGVTGWGSRPIPQQYFVEAYTTGALPDNGGFNESRFSDAEVDDLVAQAAVTADFDERADLYTQIAEIFAERGPIIVPFFAPIVGITSDSVEGLDMHPFAGRTDLRSVSISG